MFEKTIRLTASKTAVPLPDSGNRPEGEPDFY
jgi:hypothetical protein